MVSLRDPNQTREICLTAVRQESDSLRFIKNVEAYNLFKDSITSE
jgi:hypothetical protein